MHVITRSLAWGTVAFVCFAGEARADLIRLRTGGELRGKVISKAGQPTEVVTIELATGGTASVRFGDIEFITPRPANVEEYETRSRRAPDTVEGRWELAEWCRERGMTSLREQELQKVLQLDPEHEQAHRALGHTWQEGKWVDRDEWMADRGYVKYKGRYITLQELELIEKTQADLQEEQKWFQKVRLWINWVNGPNADRSQQGLALLKQIDEPQAATAVQKLLVLSKDRHYRALGVTILGQVPGARSGAALGRAAIVDDDQEVRYVALNGIRDEQRPAVIPYFVRELKNEGNVYVNRAGAALGRLGDDSAIEPLIRALRTKHRYQVRVPVTAADGISMQAGGGFAPTGSSLPPDIELQLRSGHLPNGVGFTDDAVRTKIVTVEYEHQNAEVLAALQKLTGQSFGYDARTWKLWWASAKATQGGVKLTP